MKLTSSDIAKQHEFNIAEACARGLLEQPNLSSERWCNDLADEMFILHPDMELDYPCDCEYITDEENEAFKRSLARDLRNTIERFIQDEL